MFVHITWRVVPALLLDWAKRNWIEVVCSFLFIAVFAMRYL